MIKNGKLCCFVDKGCQKNSLRKSPKNKRSSKVGKSPPRKTQSTSNREKTDAYNDNWAKKDGGRIFLGAIMGGFSAPNDTPRGTAKRKIVKVMETHGAPIKAGKKRLLLGFTGNEKVNEVSNEELPLVIIVAI